MISTTDSIKYGGNLA